MTPYQVKSKTSNETIPVPCGKCPECLKRRVSGWSFRLMQEGKNATSAHFLTLTYDTGHVPLTQKGYMQLDKRDLQLFMKRLRKKNPLTKLKYYAVGEYGGRTMRPHYHIILFNADIATVQLSWQLGQIHYGDVNGASIGYTLKYMTKPGKIPLHKNDDRLPEFSLMSKGLGIDYITPQMYWWHHADMDNRMYCNIEDGKKIAMPRYYKDKIYTDSERKRIAYFSLQNAIKQSIRHNEKMVQLYGENASAQQVSIDKRKFQKFHHDAEKNRNKI